MNSPASYFARTRLIIISLLLAFITTWPLPSMAQPLSGWVEKSNDYTRVLLEVLARHSPEYAGSLGVDGYDDQILDLAPGFTERHLRDLEDVKSKLEGFLKEEQVEPVKQDLQILITHVNGKIEGIRLEEQYLLPYYDMVGFIYGGIKRLLEDRIPPERRQAAAVRLRRYVGGEEGYEPLTEWAQLYMESEWARPGRLAPYREEVERNLSTSDEYLSEIRVLFKKYEIRGFEEDFDRLVTQIESYNQFIRTVVLPGSRDDFKQPGEIYTFQLNQYGVDMPLDQLTGRALVAFKELQAQMQILAGQIAETKGFSSGDYRDVIRSLKRDQLDSASILPFYQGQIGALEEIIKREKIVTLPERSMVVRLASPAESAASPAPFMSPPRLIGNQGEYGEFVLPTRVTGGSDGSSLEVDDFMHRAASWALTAHEGRPGHELQFTSIVERGVSQARMIFAMNSVNVEGWALYMEEQVLPFVPVEGKLMILWSRLVRAGRAFLDPGLNTGTITTEEARYILQHEIVLSDALVRSELERYRFRAPGQATSYFNGYLRLMELRAETEMVLGDRFNQLEFHDFVLSQGLLPPTLIREAVQREFIPGYK